MEINSVMENKNILIAGLPGAGKSTYIAALWSTTKRTSCDYALKCHTKPTDTTYLNKLSEKWLNAEIVDRNSNESPEDIKITWEKNSSGELINLSVPDFKGEIFSKLISGVQNADIDKNFTTASGVILFVNSFDPGTLDGELGDKTNESTSLNELFTVDCISKLVQNILLLKIIKARMGDCKIVIAISSWDLYKNVRKSAEDWLKINHKLFYNFLTSNFSNVTVVGVSAQGGSYEHGNTKELSEKTADRAYIYESSKIYDLTVLLEKFL